MILIFDKEPQIAKELPKITDKEGSDIFNSIFEDDDRPEKAVLSEADLKRFGSLKEQHQAAYTYLALACRILNNPGLTIQSQGQTIGHEKLFHFAGHAFREIGQINRAADAYWRAGVTSSRLDDLAIRSLARAKVCYQDIGETEKSDRMHVLEWRSRKSKVSHVKKWLLTLWSITSDYGTNSYLWAKCLVMAILVSTVVYELMHQLGWVSVSSSIYWTPVGSSLYYCVVTMTTLGYGDILPKNIWAQLFVIFNVLTGHLFLAVGATILGRKVIGR